MANSYSTRTGEVQSNGPLVVTPLMKSVFTYFNADFDDGEVAKGALYVMYEDSADWDSLVDHIVDNDAEFLGISEALVSLEKKWPTPEDLIRILGKHYEVDEAQIESFIERTSFDHLVEFDRVVDLLETLGQQGNLERIVSMSGYHCDRPRLYEFGGVASVHSKRLSMDVGTHSLIMMMNEVDKHLVAGDMDNAAVKLADTMSYFSSSILDERLRGELMQLTVADLNPSTTRHCAQRG